MQFLRLLSALSTAGLALGWTVTTCTDTDCSVGCFTHTGSGDSGCITTDGGVNSYIYDLEGADCAYVNTYTTTACSVNHIGISQDPSGQKYCFENKDYTLAAWEVGGC